MTALFHFAVRIASLLNRDQRQRRRVISALLAATLVMLGLGVFPLWDIFASHPLFFAIYWLVCIWLLVCVIVLAMCDLVLVMRRGRQERAAARRKFFSNLD